MVTEATQEQDPDPQGQPAASDDAAWASIEAEAAQLGAGQPGAVAAQPQSTTAQDLRGALEMVRLMAAPMFADWPDFGRVWSDQVLQATADSGGAIMDRHGWSVGELLGQWGPYIGLIAAVAPPGLATYQHLKLKRIEAERQAKAQAAREAVA